jgi:hypothetical protein
MKHDPLQKLIDAARKAHAAAAPQPPETAPLGFATRVISQARADSRPAAARHLDLLERVGWRFAVGALGVCVIAFTLHIRQPAPNPFDVFLDLEAESIP